MKKVYIISTGTELLLGTTIDTNSVFLSTELSEIGLKVVGKSVVGDNREQMERAFRIGLESADIVIATGGLGPTFDDLTKTVACEMMNCQMIASDEEVEKLKRFFASRHREMPEINLKQAMFPSEAIVLKNDKGTAPGMYLLKNEKLIILLPGPPSEMKPMFRKEVLPLLKKDFEKDLPRVCKRTIKVLGPGESRVEEMLEEVIKDNHGCSMALLAVDGEIHIKVTAEGEDSRRSEAILNEVSDRITKHMGKYVFGFNDDTLASRVADLLLEKRKMLAVAESCTGGLVGKMLTDIPGSSAVLWGGVISYSNEAKLALLNVDQKTLSDHGAVSSQTAFEMATGIRKCSGADYGLAITGVAGPGGGTEEKPVGLVYIALAAENECKVKELRFVGSRDAVRMVSARSALDILRRHLQVN
ncbi:MAG: competence/damage-inducible protein A [Bacillota bacterium]|nr:competence/damage-inducible protein A [Bacillota bacterium]